MLTTRHRGRTCKRGVSRPSLRRRNGSEKHGWGRCLEDSGIHRIREPLNRTVLLRRSGSGEILRRCGNGFWRLSFLTSTLSHIKTLILFTINLRLHTTAFAFPGALLLFLFSFYHSSGFIRFGLNSAPIQLFYAALSCAPAWRPQRYKSLVAHA